jgi:hypothetical protein
VSNCSTWNNNAGLTEVFHVEHSSSGNLTRLGVEGQHKQGERQVEAKVKSKERIKFSAYTFTCFLLSFLSAVLAIKTI